MKGKVDVDETYVGGQDDNAKGRYEGKKKLVVLAIEKKERGVSRFYGRVEETSSKRNLSRFMKDHIDPSAKVRTDKWSGYKRLESEFPKLVREKSEKKVKNIKELPRTIMMFMAWFRGVHHSVIQLQRYIDEYTYRYNRHTMTEGIFENLMNRMVKTKP